MKPFKKIIILDVDETQVQILIDSDDRSKLSQEAKSDLCIENKINQPVLLVTDKNEEICAESVTPLALTAWMEFFKELYDIHSEALNKKLSPPFALKIITTASYNETKLKNLLDKFYFHGHAIISSNKFPIEYFNYDDLEDNAKYAYPQTLSKGRLMEHNYVRWKQQHDMPELQKADVFLVDDSLEHIAGVKRYGFQGFHFDSRSKHYPKSKKTFFDTMKDYINQLREEVQQFAEKPITFAMRNGLFSLNNSLDKSADDKLEERKSSINALD